MCVNAHIDKSSVLLYSRAQFTTGRRNPRRAHRARATAGALTMNIIEQLDREQIARLAKDVPDFQPGDTLQVNVKVVEGERTRVQAYEGVCIARSGGGLNESFTVRKISYGEGVERVFPIHSPMIDSIKVVRRGKVRRGELYYLRHPRGQAAPLPPRPARAPTPQRG